MAYQTRQNLPRGKLVRTYKLHDAAFPYYALPTESTTLIVVEDPLSAAVARGWGLASLALMGTYLSSAVAFDISDWIAKQALSMNIIVALDPGAEGASLKVQRALQGVTTVPVGAIYLREDIKNHTIPEMRKLANSITGLDL